MDGMPGHEGMIPTTMAHLDGRLIRVEENGKETLRAIRSLDQNMTAQNTRLSLLEIALASLPELKLKMATHEAQIDDLEKSRDQVSGALRFWGLLILFVAPLVSTVITISVDTLLNRG